MKRQLKIKIDGRVRTFYFAKVEGKKSHKVWNEDLELIGEIEKASINDSDILDLHYEYESKLPF